MRAPKSAKNVVKIQNITFVQFILLEPVLRCGYFMFKNKINDNFFFHFIYDFQDKRKRVMRLLAQHGAERGGMNERADSIYIIKLYLKEFIKYASKYANIFNNRPIIIFQLLSCIGKLV